MRREIDNFRSEVVRTNAWLDWDEEEYVGRNYDAPAGILPEDQEIMTFVAGALRSRHRPGSTLLASDVGAGPNLYPAMLLSPYSGAIDLIEFTSANRQYLKWALRNAEPGIWGKFVEYLRNIDPVYGESFQRLRGTATPILGSILELPRHRYDIATAFFSTESITRSRIVLHQIIRSLGESVIEDGIVITAHIVGSTGYPAGDGTDFPAVTLDVDEIKRMYSAASLEIQDIWVPSHDGTAAARPGYEAMAAVVATRRRGPDAFSAFPAAPDRRTTIGDSPPDDTGKGLSSRGSGASPEL